MRFTASLALAAAAVVPAVLAQSVTINLVTPLTQCATSTITFVGSSGPYYVAVVPSSDPCTEDALAEFYDVASGSQDYYVNQPSGTSVQIYLMDVNGVENWSQIYTVGNGDNSCLGGSGADAAAQAPSDTPAPSDPAPAPATTSTTDAVTTSSTPAPAPYVPPSPSTTAAALTHANNNSGNTNTGGSNTGSSTTNNSGGNIAPANAANDSSTNGASSLSASVTLLVGAFAAVVALF